GAQRSSRALLRVDELEVDVLKGRTGDGQLAQVLIVLQRPPGERVEQAGRLERVDVDPAVAQPRHGGELVRQLAEGGARRKGERDVAHRPITATECLGRAL